MSDMPPFSIDMAVRDYECDMQGVVNNAVYQNYLEHARHEYLRSVGVDFAALAAEGVNLVVIRVEIDYRYPLRSGDRFSVSVVPEPVSPARLGFRQIVRRLPDGREVIRAFVTGTAMNDRGRPRIPKTIANLFSSGNEVNP